MTAAVVVGFQLLAGVAEVEPTTTACATPAQSVHEERFVPIGGIEQWVTIKGKGCGNPVILFLHGGPGNPLSPYADSIYGSWDGEFTLVQWDQRGAGRTYARNAPPAELTIERMTEDGIELAEYLARHLGKEKIILTGGSWGSILGVYMAQARPDLFYAYVGFAQVVSYGENQSASYSKVMAMARAADDQETVRALEAVGPPPWENPRNFGVLRRATRAYEAKTSAPSQSWEIRSADYDTPQMVAEESEAEDFSFLQFLGLKGDGMFSRVDLPKLGRAFEIPVFLIQGSADLVAIPDVAKRYFKSITAPHKKFVLLPRTGHDLNQAMVDTQHSIMIRRVRPLVK
jgi:pimeloyl-ACP methyl ester carboxylesterase